MEKKFFQLEISPLWSLISDVKNKVTGMMEGCGKGVTDFTVMVVSELMENAIKYGITNEVIPNVGVEFTIENSLITVRVRNGIKNEEHIQDFLKIMHKIMVSENKEELYFQRMQEIMENPELGGSQLGLYRIVSEGKFNLNYKVENKVLEIIATKKIEEGQAK